VSSALGYLAIINLMLGLFNLLPGLPLDGGRILHALVWRRTGDKAHATRVAVGAGVAVGYLLVTAGIIYVFTGYWVNGLWLVFLGWYLQSVAGRELQATQAHSLFAGMRAIDLTDTNPHAVDPDMSLEQVVDDVMMRYQARAVPVVANGVFRGLLTLQRIAQTPKTEWPAKSASAVMIPAEEVATVSPDQPLESAIAQMQKRDVNQLVVVENGALVGLLSRSTVLRQLEIRNALSKDGQTAGKPRRMAGRA
jgi:CBS domain-containing protein